MASAVFGLTNCVGLNACDAQLGYGLEGTLSVHNSDQLRTLELTSAAGIFHGSRPAFMNGLFDVFTSHRIFLLRPQALPAELDFGQIILPNLSCELLLSDLSARGAKVPSGEAIIGLGNLCDGAPPADLDGDGQVTPSDADFLTLALSSGTSTYDLDRSGESNVADLRYYVRWMLRTDVGDVNLDQRFDSQDLVRVFEAGQYEDHVPGNSKWTTGDWDADGDFASTDLVVAFQDGGYGKSEARAASPIPEPALSPLWLFLGAVRVQTPCRRRRSQSGPPSPRAAEN